MATRRAIRACEGRARPRYWWRHNTPERWTPKERAKRRAMQREIKSALAQAWAVVAPHVERERRAMFVTGALLQFRMRAASPRQGAG